MLVNKGIYQKLLYSSSENDVKIYEYNSYTDEIIYIANLNFDQSIHSISSAINDDSVKIYTCLDRKKEKKFILKEELLQLSDIVIEDEKNL